MTHHLTATMKSYFILKYLAPVILMFGWVLYQLAIKKKKWGDIQGDALACCMFAAVWIAIAYWLTN